MERNPIEIGTVTAELALRHDSWPRELRGVCERLYRAPKEALVAMTVRIRLKALDEERSLRELSERLAREYGFRQAVACDGTTCTIRLSRRAGPGETMGGDDERP